MFVGQSPEECSVAGYNDVGTIHCDLSKQGISLEVCCRQGTAQTEGARFHFAPVSCTRDTRAAFTGRLETSDHIGQKGFEAL